jgi:cytochrome c551/c552
MVAFTAFMKFLDQPAPACIGSACWASIQDGHNLFLQTGCSGCHTETLMTGLSSKAALNNKPAHLFSG